MQDKMDRHAFPIVGGDALIAPHIFRFLYSKSLVLSVIVAVVILLHTLRDIEAKAKKSACDNSDQEHKR